MFTLDTESGFDQVVLITSSYGLGEIGRAGRGEPGRVLRLQAEPRRGASGDPAQERRQQGDADGASPTRRGRRVDARPSTCPRRSAMRFSITDAQAEELARYAVAIEQHYGRPMDIEWGTRRRRRRALHPAGAAGDGEVARRRQCAAPLSVEVDTRSCSRRDARSARRSARARCGWSSRRRRWIACRRRRARHRDDRSRLGAGDEARQRDRHQSRRTHVPRGDHRARTGHSGGRRMRRRDAHADARLRLACIEVPSSGSPRGMSQGCGPAASASVGDSGVRYTGIRAAPGTASPPRRYAIPSFRRCADARRRQANNPAARPAELRGSARASRGPYGFRDHDSAGRSDASMDVKWSRGRARVGARGGGRGSA